MVLIILMCSDGTDESATAWVEDVVESEPGHPAKAPATGREPGDTR